MDKFQDYIDSGDRGGLAEVVGGLFQKMNQVHAPRVVTRAGLLCGADITLQPRPPVSHAPRAGLPCLHAPDRGVYLPCGD